MARRWCFCPENPHDPRRRGRQFPWADRLLTFDSNAGRSTVAGAGRFGAARISGQRARDPEQITRGAWGVCVGWMKGPTWVRGPSFPSIAEPVVTQAQGRGPGMPRINSPEGRLAPHVPFFRMATGADPDRICQAPSRSPAPMGQGFGRLRTLCRMGRQNIDLSRFSLHPATGPRNGWLFTGRNAGPRLRFRS